MTQLEITMCNLMAVFDKYAKDEGKKDTLSNIEAKKLLVEQLPGLIKNAKNPELVDKLINGLDLNGDKEIDFAEFVVVVGGIACACHGRVKK